MKGDSIIQEHLRQNYGTYDEDLSFDDLISSYAHFPNEAVYIIDCQKAELEPLTKNFGQIIGIDLPHQNKLTTLYEHVGGNHDEVLKYMHDVIQCGFDRELNYSLEEDYTCCLYSSFDGRTLMKYTTVLQKDSHGLMRYSLGKLVDVSGLIPFRRFTHQFHGPSSVEIQTKFNQIQGVIGSLSKREREILHLIGIGLSSQQIAEKLFISRLTVDKHRRNILTKIRVESTGEAYFIAKNRGEL